MHLIIALSGKQGQRNTRKNLPLILAELSSLRAESQLRIAAQCCQMSISRS